MPKEDYQKIQTILVHELYLYIQNLLRGPGTWSNQELLLFSISYNGAWFPAQGAQYYKMIPSISLYNVIHATPANLNRSRHYPIRPNSANFALQNQIIQIRSNMYLFICFPQCQYFLSLPVSLPIHPNPGSNAFKHHSSCVQRCSNVVRKPS